MKRTGSMAILLVSGFLGAGKTTLIKHLIKSPVEGVGKMAVLVNEFGEVGIDGTILAGRDIDVVELTGGCICCSIKTDFFKAIGEIYGRIRPDLLLVESTGIAQPGDILDVLSDPTLKQISRLLKLVTVVDAGFFKVKEVLGSFYINQVRCADILILNKVDSVEPEKLEEIEAQLREMNPRTMIFPARYCAIDPLMLMQSFSEEIPAPKHDHDEDEHTDELSFQTFSFEDGRPMERDRFVTFLDSLPPTLFRCKGYIRFHDASVLLDFTGGRYRMTPSENPRSTALAFIGRNCDSQEILDALSQCFRKEPPDR
ncbi:CobW family GTP-binding protein [Thermodesulfobacteriota bacterium]